jgi:hypothetical protein
MFERTTAMLSSDPDVPCEDSCFAFGFGANDHGTCDIEAVLAFFGSAFLAPSISGNGEIEIFVAGSVLKEIDSSEAHSQITQLLEDDFRMFSSRAFNSAALRAIAATFLEEMGDCKFYSNTSRSTSYAGCASWSPVTRHSKDMLVCAISRTHVSYWAYGDDE